MTASCLVLGAGGQVGLSLQDEAATTPLTLVFLDRAGLDITDCEAILKTTRRIAPAVVINAAAYTDVDAAESDPAAAFAVNRDGASYLARACNELDIPLISISTDFVFDGRSRRSYGEDDRVAPVSVYGQSKAEGEGAIRSSLDRHIILRTSWIFSAYGRNFVKTIYRLAREKGTLKIVDDQIGGPTPAKHVSQTLLVLAQRALTKDVRWGTYHFCGVPSVSRFDFAAEAVANVDTALSTQTKISAIKTEDYPLPAKRPPNSVLDCTLINETFGITQPDWHTELDRACRVLGEQAS